MVIAVIVVLLVLGGVGIAVMASGGDDDDNGGVAAGDTDDNTDTTSDDDLDLDLPDDELDDTLPDLETTTSAAPLEAEAAVHDCIAVDSAGYFAGTGSCSTGGAPYKVVEVVDGYGSCTSFDNAYISSGDYLLCLEVNVIETYCYVIPEEGWIQSSECDVAGSSHVVDVVLGAYDDTACTDEYVWDIWYDFDNPPMVVCVDEY